MRILYVGMKDDYGIPERGYSFEHHNFYHCLVHMGYDVLYFDFMALLRKHGPRSMNRRLMEVAQTEKPQLLFSVLFKDEIDWKVIRAISDNTDTATVNWFADDHWRFESFSRRWAPHFNWIVTTSEGALSKYERIGMHNVIKSQWGCNHFLYRKLDLPLSHDVTFVGQPHGIRGKIIEALRDAGIKVSVWGTGWNSGRLSQEEMISVFNQSRINLNLSNASVESSGRTAILGTRLRASASQLLDCVYCGDKLKRLAKRTLTRGIGGQASTDKSLPGDMMLGDTLDQIKGRNFEVPGCGGFLLTSPAENLSRYYSIGREMAVFETFNQLKESIRYFLEHDEERHATAQAAYRRTLSEHTYVHRFKEIFDRMGLPVPPLESMLAGKVTPGQTVEVV